MLSRQSTPLSLLVNVVGALLVRIFRWGSREELRRRLECQRYQCSLAVVVVKGALWRF